MVRVLATVAALGLALGAVPITAVSAAAAPIPSTIPIGYEPTGVVMSPDGSHVYVAAGFGLSVIATATNTVEATIPLGPGSIHLAISPDGSRLYVTSEGSTVWVIATDTNAVVEKMEFWMWASGVAVAPDGLHIYVTDRMSSTVSVVATATNTLLGDPIAVGPLPQHPVVAPDGRHVYVLHEEGAVSVITMATNTVGATVPLGVQASHAAISPDGSRLYVSHPWGEDASGLVSVIATATNTVVATIPTEFEHWGLTVSPDGSYVYVTNPSMNSVSVIATATNTIVGDPITVGAYPAHVVASPDGTHLYVTNWFSRTVSAIELAALPAISLPDATVGEAYAFTLPATNVSSFAVTGGSLPAGLSLDATSGELSGTPTAAGSHVFTITGTGPGQPLMEYTIVVAAIPVLPAASIPDATVGAAYSFTVPASDVSSFAVTAGALPAGLSLNATSGVISGIPITVGPHTFTITGTGQFSQVTRQYTIGVVAAAVVAPPVTPPVAPHPPTVPTQPSTPPDTIAPTQPASPVQPAGQSLGRTGASVPLFIPGAALTCLLLGAVVMVANHRSRRSHLRRNGDL